MNGRARVSSLAASPTMVGAITTLIVIVAVFLAYNANNGLPFVPTYRVSAEICDAARLAPNNEVRIGGNRVGVVESIDTVPAPPNSGCQARRRVERLHRRQAQPEARQERRPASRRLDDPRPLPLLVRAQVPRDRPRHQRPGPARGRHAAARAVRAAGRVRRRLQHLRHRHPREQPARAAGLRRRLRRPRRLAERGDRRPQPAVREPEAGLQGPRRSDHAAWSASSPSSPTRRGSSLRSPWTTPSSSRNGAIAFGAISSDPQALRDTISEGPPTLEAGHPLAARPAARSSRTSPSSPASCGPACATCGPRCRC